MFMAGTKFNTSRSASTTWALNALLPSIVAERYAGVPTVVFSSGNVYPFTPIAGPHADETTAPAPVGEYAWSVLARERIFEHFADREGTPTLLYRLNYWDLICESAYLSDSEHQARAARLLKYSVEGCRPPGQVW